MDLHGKRYAVDGGIQTVVHAGLAELDECIAHWVLSCLNLAI